MQQVRFRVAIPARRFEDYYRGAARHVLVRAEDGRSIQLPASLLRPFLDHQGVYGEFLICFDENHKLVDIRRL
jgi:hypothetical protein